MEIAKDFELEAFEYLKTIFESVDYISNKITSSPYDFVVYKDGKLYYGDAKISINKPSLTPTQKNIDFIITKNNIGEIKIYWKDEIKKKCIINKATIIKIDERTKKQLDKIKIIPKESYDSVIQRILNRDKIKNAISNISELQTTLKEVVDYDSK